MKTTEFTSLLKETEKIVKNGKAFGIISLPTNSLKVDKILYEPMEGKQQFVSLVSNDFKIDLSWSRLNKSQQKEIIEKIETIKDVFTPANH